MAGQNASRQSPSLEKLAMLEVMVETVQQEVTRIRKYLEGNGAPGLLQRTAELGRAVTDQHEQAALAEKAGSAQMADIRHALREVTLLQKSTQEQLDDLSRRVGAHLDPANLDHKTLARAWATDPKSILKGAGVVLIVGYLLNAAGVLEQIGAFLVSLR